MALEASEHWLGDLLTKKQKQKQKTQLTDGRIYKIISIRANQNPSERRLETI